MAALHPAAVPFSQRRSVTLHTPTCCRGWPQVGFTILERTSNAAHRYREEYLMRRATALSVIVFVRLNKGYLPDADPDNITFEIRPYGTGKYAAEMFDRSGKPMLGMMSPSFMPRLAQYVVHCLTTLSINEAIIATALPTLVDVPRVVKRELLACLTNKVPVGDRRLVRLARALLQQQPHAAQIEALSWTPDTNQHDATLAESQTFARFVSRDEDKRVEETEE